MAYNPKYEAPPFTDFGSVTTGTCLRSLNLNWRERDLPERERTKHVHRLHPYLGKFIPQLAEISLRKFRPVLVCDPLCGSGMSRVEAAALAVHSLRCDISQFDHVLTPGRPAPHGMHFPNDETNAVLTIVNAHLRRGGFSSD